MKAASHRDRPFSCKKCGNLKIAALAAAILCFTQPLAYAQSAPESASVQAFDIPAQPLATALREFARQSGQELLFSPDVAAEKATGGIKGTLPPLEALSALLQNTGIGFSTTSNGAILLRNNDAQATQGARTPMGLTTSVPSVPQVSAGESGLDSDLTNVIELEEIVVIGTHIRGSTAVGAPVTVFTREEIEASGHGRLQDFFETVPQNASGTISEDNSTDARDQNLSRGATVDLRGLGAGTTLVLVNGRRQATGGLEGAFVDISSIASSAVQRVEILTDGASALYGSDAIGGVVNFVLRRDYDGVEARARFATIDGNAEERQAGILAGANWSGGNALFGYDYSQRDALMRADTPYGRLNGDLRSLGGDDFRQFFGNPGTILNASNQPAFAIPAGQDGSILTPADLTSGQNYRDTVSTTALLPEQIQHSAFLSVNHEIAEGVELFAEARYATRDMTLLFGGFSSASYVVPNTNPFYVNPFGTTAPVRVAIDLQDDIGGPSTQISETETYALTVGARVDIGPEWMLDLTGSFGREENYWEQFNILDATRFAAALADINPATSLNVFGDGAVNNPATIDALRLVSRQYGETTTQSYTAIADGPLFQLPAGTVRLAIGADYRDDALDGNRSNLAPATGIVTVQPIAVGSIDRQVSAAFGELVVPLVRTNDHSVLELALAGRYEEYSDFGSTFNPKVGISISPIEDLVLRGTWGTSFRAPRLHELSPTKNPSRANYAPGVLDPQSPSGRSNVLSISGGNPDLQEETAETVAIGFDWRPNWLSGLSVSATYFRIAYDGKISAGASSVAVALQRANEWEETITRAPTAAQIADVCDRPDFVGDTCGPTDAIVDLRLRNLASLEVDGLDLSATYTVEAPIGELTFGLSGTNTFTYERAISSTSPAIDVLDTVGNPLRLRMRAHATWNVDAWSAHGAINYSDDYRDSGTGRSVNSWTTVDASLAYRLSREDGTNNGTLRLSATNLFDEDPPFVNQAAGYDAFSANQVGRTVSLMLSIEF